MKDNEDKQTMGKIDQFWVEQYANWKKNDYFNKSMKGQMSIIQPRFNNQRDKPRIY